MSTHGGPQSYTTATIRVQPWAMHAAALGIGVAIEAVAASVSTVFAAMDALSLGWGGATQEEAHAFGLRWNACMNALFGPDPEHPGVLDVLYADVRVASVNYSLTETHLAAMFTGFTTPLLAGLQPAEASSGGPHSLVEAVNQPGGADNPIVAVADPNTRKPST